MSLHRKVIIGLILVVSGWSRLPDYKTVQVQVEKQGDRISVRDSEGRGVLFYRGMDEVGEWLTTRPESWEADLQSVVRTSLRGDSLPEFLPKQFRLFEPKTVAMGIGVWSINNIWSFGSQNTGTATTFQLDSAFVYGTSGDALVVAFNSPVSQTNAALTAYFYCTAKTGTPNESVMDIYASAGAGEDAQRPDTGGSPLATSSNVDPSACGTPQWLTYPIASISLTRGQWYFLIVRNTEGAPGTDNFTITSRSIVNGYGSIVDIMRSCQTTDGITTDPTCSSGILGHGVLKFGDGTIWGNPYVTSSASASNTNYRGNRYTFPEDVIVSGVKGGGTITTSIDTTLEVYSGASQLATTTLDVASKGNSIAAFFAPITFPGGTDIDVVMKPASASNLGSNSTMGNSPPADVQAAAGVVTGVNGATPGSFTETANQFIPYALIVDTNPAISGGSSAVVGAQ